MSQTMRQDGEMHYEIREVVGLFPNAGALETAVEQLGIVGFDRAAISVLEAAAQRNGQNGWQQTAPAVADDPCVTRAAFMSHVSRVELRARRAWIGLHRRSTVCWRRRQVRRKAMDDYDAISLDRSVN